MTAQQYLEYLINTQKQYEAGETSIGVRAVELALLQMWINSEKQ